MKNLRTIKDRIKSIKKTETITKAMKMVAAAKLKRNEQALKRSQCYLKAQAATLNNLKLRMEPSIIPFHFHPNSANGDYIIVFSSDRGLCGGFNQNIYKELMQQQLKNSEKNPMAVIGKKGIKFAQRKKWMINKSYENEKFKYDQTEEIVQEFINLYLEQKIKSVQLIFTQFLGARQSKIENKQLLPLSLDQETTDYYSDYNYGSGIEVITLFLSRFLEFQIYEAYLSSKAAEEASRMLAMDSSANNARDLNRRLILQYNQSRQTIITKEITEIVSGIEALAKT